MGNRRINTLHSFAQTFVFNGVLCLCVHTFRTLLRCSAASGLNSRGAASRTLPPTRGRPAPRPGVPTGTEAGTEGTGRAPLGGAAADHRVGLLREGPPPPTPLAAQGDAPDCTRNASRVWAPFGGRRRPCWPSGAASSAPDSLAPSGADEWWSPPSKTGLAANVLGVQLLSPPPPPAQGVRKLALPNRDGALRTPGREGRSAHACMVQVPSTGGGRAEGGWETAAHTPCTILRLRVCSTACCVCVSTLSARCCAVQPSGA